MNKRFDPHAALADDAARVAKIVIASLLRAKGDPPFAAKIAGDWLGREFPGRRWSSPSPAAALIDAAIQTKSGVVAVGDPVLEEPVSVILARAIAESIIGRLPAVRMVPFRSSGQAQLTGSGAAWFVPGNTRIPVGRSEFANVAHEARSVGALCVYTSDFARAVDFGEERLLDDTVNAVREQLDATFASDDAATGAAPAGIAYGAQTVASTGSTFVQVAADLRGMVAVVSGAQPVWLLSRAANSFFRLLKISDPDGGLAGFPVIGSAAASGVTLLASDRVCVSLGRVMTTVSNKDSVLMDDNPTDGAQNEVSLFATNSVAVLTTAQANWSLAGPSDTAGASACVTLTNPSYA